MTLGADDLFAIHHLYARYNHAIDFGSAEEWADCFSADARFDSGVSIAEGRDALLEFHAVTRQMVPDIRHLTSNIVVDGDGDVATGAAYIRATSGAGADTATLMTGVYRDRIVRTADGWRFAARVTTHDG